MLKAIVAIIIFYMLVKVISGLFLPSAGNSNKKGNFRFFYQTFKNVREQQKKQQEQQKSRTSDGKVKNRLDDIEEAEYEDITEDKSEQ